MPKSFFTYTLTRSYPFRWFTWVVVLGGIPFTVFISLINIAAEGYTSSIIHTTNTEQSLAEHPLPKWMHRWPFSKVSKINATCQSNDLPVGSRFFTDKFALPYTLESAWQGSDDSPQLIPSISYLADTLHNCSVNNVQIELLAEDRTAEQYGWNQWGPKARASATCSIIQGTDAAKFNLSTQYDLVPTTVGNGQQQTLLSIDRQRGASLWWGQSLLSMNWVLLSGKMQALRESSIGNSSNLIRKGSINLKPSTDRDMSDLTFFDVHYHFIYETQPSGDILIIANQGTETLLDYEQASTEPSIWAQADAYGKALYSTVLADLGQSSDPNILLDANLLQQYTQNFSSNYTGNAKPGPATQSYEDLRTQTGPLSITQSTIYQEYICQVPVRKSIGSIIILVIIADLVFVQTLWKLFSLSVTWYVGRKFDAAFCCERCSHLGQDSESSRSASKL